MLRWVLVGTFALSLGALSCSSDADDNGNNKTAGAGGSAGAAAAQLSCKYSNCEHEPVVWTTEAACEALRMSPCYTQQKAWLDCKLAKEQCDENGKIVLNSIESCQALNTALNDCLATVDP